MKETELLIDVLFFFFFMFLLILGIHLGKSYIESKFPDASWKKLEHRILIVTSFENYHSSHQNIRR